MRCSCGAWGTMRLVRRDRSLFVDWSGRGWMVSIRSVRRKKEACLVRSCGSEASAFPQAVGASVRPVSWPGASEVLVSATACGSTRLSDRTRVVIGRGEDVHAAGGVITGLSLGQASQPPGLRSCGSTGGSVF